MKKKLSLLILCVVATSSLIVSCIEIEEDSFDKALIYGKWVYGTEFYKYNSNGTGVTWDQSDDVNEDEAQAFTWTLVETDLTHIHIMESNETGITKSYTVTRLTETKLEYEDIFGVKYSYDKVTDSP